MRLGILAAIGVLALAGCQKSAGTSAPPADAAAGGPVEVDPGALQMCDVLQVQTTADDCERATLAQSKVERGVAALKYPERMKLDEPSLVRLAVGEEEEPPPPPPPPEPTPPPPEPKPDPADAATAAADPEAGPEPTPPRPKMMAKGARPPPPEIAETPAGAVEPVEGKVVEYRPLIGQYMSARLEHDGSFEVKALRPEAQRVLPDSVTTWDWTVTPKKGGRHVLTVVTQVGFQDTAGKFVPLRVAPVSKQVTVDVPWWRYLLDALNAAPGWIKALTAVIVAGTGLLTAWAALRMAARGRKPGGGPPPARGP